MECPQRQQRRILFITANQTAEMKWPQESLLRFTVSFLSAVYSILWRSYAVVVLRYVWNLLQDSTRRDAPLAQSKVLLKWNSAFTVIIIITEKQIRIYERGLIEFNVGRVIHKMNTKFNNAKHVLEKTSPTTKLPYTNPRTTNPCIYPGLKNENIFLTSRLKNT